MATTRRDCLRHMGDKCCICGENDLRVLQFDHLNGDGYRLRNHGPKGGYTSGWEYAKAIIASYNNGTIKEKYQLLCANHNIIKRREKGETRKHAHHDAPPAPLPLLEWEPE
jgi:hypothetical protein